VAIKWGQGWNVSFSCQHADGKAILSLSSYLPLLRPAVILFGRKVIWLGHFIQGIGGVTGVCEGVKRSEHLASGHNCSPLSPHHLLSAVGSDCEVCPSSTGRQNASKTAFFKSNHTVRQTCPEERQSLDLIHSPLTCCDSMARNEETTDASDSWWLQCLHRVSFEKKE
jgi:hypothetical protein